MTDMTKRLNFFTGFFTTAEDWNEGQNYHLEKRKLHNRALHTPGIIRGEGQELRVEAAGGLNVRVLPGAALDGGGNEVCLDQAQTLTINLDDYTLPQPVYIAIQYQEEPADYVENVEAPQYSGHTRIAEIPRLRAVNTMPDNRTWLELARIDLQPGVTEIADPSDPDNPLGNQIDRRYVAWAGAVGVAGERLSPVILERLVQLMGRKRRDFAALAGRFPVPSADDVRHAALSVEMLARIGCVRPEQLPGVLSAIAAIEQDVEQEIGTAYAGVTTSPEFQAYQDAVANLLEALKQGEGLDILLTRQDELAEAARELSEIVLQPPVAEAGPGEVTVPTPGDTGTVTLDAANSRAFGGREIVRYHWILGEGYVRPPVADAGGDRTLSTSGDETTLKLDASGSRAFDEREVERYYWDRREDD